MPLDPQATVPGQDVEVAIIMEHARVLSNGDRSNEAIHQLSHRLAPGATRAVQFRCRFEVDQTSQREARKPDQAYAKLRTLDPASRSGQKLHDDGLCRGDG